jgi:hypothetical protein
MNNNNYNFNSFPFIINIAAAILVIYSMNQIEKNASVCQCSINPKKRFIKEWFLIFITINFINIFASLIFVYFIFSQIKNINSVFKYIYIYIGYLIIIGIIHFIMVVRTFLYLNYLRNSCTCAYNLPEKILFWYFLISISLVITILSALFIIGLLYLSSLKYR